MTNKSIKKQAEDLFNNIPVNSRKLWVLAFCISVFLLSIVKTVVSIMSRRSLEKVEILDSTDYKNMRILTNEIERIDESIINLRDSISLVYNDSIKLDGHEK